MGRSKHDRDDREPISVSSPASRPANNRATFIVATVAAAVTATSWIYSSQAESWQPHRESPDAIANASGYADESRCIECHAEASTFKSTGHAQTLHRASDQFSLDRLRAFQETAELSNDFSLDVIAGVPIAVTRDESVERQVPLDWCFGSGAHAHTWTSTLSDARGATDLLEFRWTWFHSLDDFSVTPGQATEPPRGSIVSIGVQFDGPKAERCFSCHATTVPAADGRIDETAIRPGVTCQRCHGPMEDHVKSEGEHLGAGWKPSDAIDRIEAVQRCAVCHRMPEERDPHEIRPGNLDIVRFQPMGLLQSQCFLKSDMSCTTCHNPHQPLDEQDARGIWQCVQCHDPQQTDHVLCGAGMIENCLECHMPALNMEFPVSFTDHWIRVRTERNRGSAGGNGDE